jgi:hypothetical protein
LVKGKWYCSRFRHYATSLKVAGSFLDEIIGFFYLPIPSSRTMTLEYTQSLKEMNIGNIPESKGHPEGEVDKLSAICGLTFQKCGSLYISQPYRTP